MWTFHGTCRFVRCKADVKCSAENTDALVEMYVRKILNEIVGRSDTSEVVDASKIVVRAFDGVSEWNRMK